MIAINIKFIKILLIEDSKEDAQIIMDSLKELGIKYIEWVVSYRQAVSSFEKSSFDLIICDIFLGKQKRRGDRFIRHIRQQKFMTPVIYLTSAYDLKIYEEVKKTLPRCFLNKNISLLSLRQAIELSLIPGQNSNTPAPQINPDKFYIKIGDKHKAVKLIEVPYFYSQDKTIYIQFRGRNYPVNLSLKNLEDALYYKKFVRVHRKYLINLDLVDYINLPNNTIHINEVMIPIGYNYRKEFLSRMDIIG